MTSAASARLLQDGDELAPLNTHLTCLMTLVCCTGATDRDAKVAEKGEKQHLFRLEIPTRSTSPWGQASILSPFLVSLSDAEQKLQELDPLSSTLRISKTCNIYAL